MRNRAIERKLKAAILESLWPRVHSSEWDLFNVQNDFEVGEITHSYKIDQFLNLFSLFKKAKKNIEDEARSLE
jgi:hypothetical protein